jgi:ribonuclease BN (tRNA processing enzyme)
MTLSLQFIGCGDAFVRAAGYNTCFHLTGETTNLLIDCGASSLVAMKRLGVDRNPIQRWSSRISHADHCRRHSVLHPRRAVLQQAARAPTIVGPSGFPNGNETSDGDRVSRIVAGAQKFDLTLVEIAAGQSLAVGGHHSQRLIRRCTAAGRTLLRPCRNPRRKDVSIAYSGEHRK